MHGNKKFNTYDLSGDFGVGYTLKGEEFWFDLEDYDKIKYACWFVETKGRLVSRNYETSGTTTPIKFHRLVMGFPDPKEFDIDHIFGNQLDNRKESLQLCKHFQNISKKKKQLNNTSGVTGVCFRNDTNKWVPKIEVNKTVYILGNFINFEDAVIARLEAELKYFGNFAPQRHLFNQYNII